MEEEEYEERNYYEIQLNNRQLVLVFIGTIIIGLVLFVLGVNVGKNKKEIELTSLGSELQAETYMPENRTAKPAQQEIVETVIPEAADRRDTMKGTERTTTKTSEKAEDVQKPERRRKSTPPAKKVETVSPPPAAPGQYTVQVASLTSPDAANLLKQRLTSRGYDPIYIVTYDKGGQPYYRVRVGSFASRQAAGATAEQLEGEEKLNLKTWVCKLDQ